MKKYVSVVLALILCLGLLGGCGQSYEAERSTVFVLKDGKIVSTDVETFDSATYDEAGLKGYVEQAIAAYMAENGSNSVVMKSLAVEEGKATLILEYASADDYAKFNGIELYNGSVASALSSGYSFDGEFASVSNGNAALCQVNDFLGGDYKVVIIKGNTNVRVPGTVMYVSTKNTNYVDASTIAISEGTNLLGQALEDSTEEADQTVDGTEALETEGSEINEEELSDSDDDLLAASNEDAEVVFEFDDEPHTGGERTEEFSEVYTYIIYK